MRTQFIGYYRPSNKDFKIMWETGLFVFDTNVLLDFFRYSNDTVDELFKILNIISERIWLPYQVAKEFHRNLPSIISEQVRKYDESLKTLKSFREQIEQERNHPFLDLADKTEVSKFCDKFTKILEQKKTGIKELILTNPIKERIADFFAKKVGEKMSEEKLLEIYEEGRNRYKNRIPPGYMDDKTKDEPRKFNDLVIWKEILEKNRNIKQPLLFITRDTKEDWFLKEMGLTIGPRPELINEFCSVNPENLFYIYTTTQFLEYSNKYLNAKIDKKSIEEISELIKKFIEERYTNSNKNKFIIEDFISLDDSNDNDTDTDDTDEDNIK